MISYRLVLLVLMVILQGVSRHSSVNAQLLAGDTSVLIDKLFTNWNDKTPGAVVQVSRGGLTVYHKAFGMSDLEDGIANRKETIFEAGSVSKQFTAAAALLLVLEGKISLNDPIRKYFPDFPSYGDAITINHLFNHTSGLRDWGAVAEIGGWPRGSRIYTPAHVKSIIWRQTATNFTPGTRYSYSNSNYSMLVFLVEKVSGKTLQAFTSERLFKPFGMLNTKWRDNFRQIVPGRAQAYMNSFNQTFLTMPFENTFGHGALLTTTDDLTKWNQHWSEARLPDAFNTLQKEKGKLLNGTIISYARGVVVDKHYGHEEISHSGATAGYRAWLAFYPAKQLSVALLSNDGNHNPVETGKKIADILIGKEPPTVQDTSLFVPFRKEWGDKMTGVYKADSHDEILELLWQGNKLAVKNEGELKAFSPDTFQLNDSKIIFTANGQTNRLILHYPGGDTATFSKMDTRILHEAGLKEFTGTYHSEEADLKVKVGMENGRLIITSDPDRRFLLTPKFTDAFSISGQQLISFNRKKKKITGFGWSANRAAHVWFEKVPEK